MWWPQTVAARTLRSPLFVFYLTAAYLAVVAVIRPEIISRGNLADVIISAMPLLALAVGQTVVLISGGIDLSLTALVSLASVVGAQWMTQSALPGWSEPAKCTAAIVCVFLVGVSAGLAHGVAVAFLRMPAFLVTLVSLMFTGGLATLITKSRPVGDLPESFLQLADGTVGGLPYPILLIGGLCVLVHLGLRHTVWGRQLYAVGQNAATARVSGVPVRRMLVSAYVVSGISASVATLLYMARLETGKPDLVSVSVLLDCIGAVVIGGTSLMGGRGTILGTVLGALFITLVGNSLNLFGNLQIWHVLMVKGGIILMAAALEAARTRLNLGGGPA